MNQYFSKSYQRGNTVIIATVIIAVFIGVFWYLRFSNVHSNPAISNTALPTSSATTQPPTLTPKSTVTPASQYPLFDVPFTAQAPFGDWSDPHQEDGCEEATALMAVSWARSQTFTPEEALRQILAASQYQERIYGSYQNTSAEDSVIRIYKGFFGYNNVSFKQNINKEDIKKALLSGQLVVVPMNGQKLGNPHYKQPGPLRHSLVIKGYDAKSKEFITNDSGTRYGNSYRYDENVLQNALLDYPTGDSAPIIEGRTAMITISR